MSPRATAWRLHAREPPVPAQCGHSHRHEAFQPLGDTPHCEMQRGCPVSSTPGASSGAARYRGGALHASPSGPATTASQSGHRHASHHPPRPIMSAARDKMLSTPCRARLRAARHYRIPAPGDMPWKAPSAASGRRNGSDGPCASDRPPDEHHHGADHRLVGRVTSMSGRPGFAARRMRPPVLHNEPADQRRVAGTFRPHLHDSAVGRRLVGIDGREVARPCERRQRVVADALDERLRAEHRARPLPIPQASGPLPARRGAQPHPVVGQRQHRLGGTGGDRGRDDDIAASAQPAEAGCVAAMPSNQLRTLFVPMTSTRRSPNAGSIHRRTLNAYVFRVAGFQRSAQSASSGPSVRLTTEPLHRRRTIHVLRPFGRARSPSTGAALSHSPASSPSAVVVPFSS